MTCRRCTAPALWWTGRHWLCAHHAATVAARVVLLPIEALRWTA